MKNRLCELRSEHGLLQENLAKEINCSQQLISNYETGKMKRIPVNFEEKLCDYFNCTLDYLRCRTNIRNEEKYSQTLTKIKIKKKVHKIYLMKNLQTFKKYCHILKIYLKSFQKLSNLFII